MTIVNDRLLIYFLILMGLIAIIIWTIIFVQIQVALYNQHISMNNQAVQLRLLIDQSHELQNATDTLSNLTKNSTVNSEIHNNLTMENQELLYEINETINIITS